MRKLEKSPFVYYFKHQIIDLALTISDENRNELRVRLLTEIYGRIFGLCTCLLKLEIEDDDTDVLSLSTIVQ